MSFEYAVIVWIAVIGTLLGCLAIAIFEALRPSRRWGSNPLPTVDKPAPPPNPPNPKVRAGRAIPTCLRNPCVWPRCACGVDIVYTDRYRGTKQ